jgi:hypothetical protein
MAGLAIFLKDADDILMESWVLGCLRVGFAGFSSHHASGGYERRTV